MDSARAFPDDVADGESVFLLDPGLGPGVYLTADGRVLIDGRGWDGSPIREAEEDEAVRGVVSGARKTGIPELLKLLPAAPADAAKCVRCDGTRWFVMGTNVATKAPGQVVCPNCSGRGWTPAGVPQKW